MWVLAEKSRCGLDVSNIILCLNEEFLLLLACLLGCLFEGWGVWNLFWFTTTRLLTKLLLLLIPNKRHHLFLLNISMWRLHRGRWPGLDGLVLKGYSPSWRWGRGTVLHTKLYPLHKVGVVRYLTTSYLYLKKCWQIHLDILTLLEIRLLNTINM